MGDYIIAVDKNPFIPIGIKALHQLSSAHTTEHLPHEREVVGSILRLCKTKVFKTGSSGFPSRCSGLWK